MFEKTFSRLLAVLLCVSFLLILPGPAATASRSPGYPLPGAAPGLAAPPAAFRTRERLLRAAPSKIPAWGRSHVSLWQAPLWRSHAGQSEWGAASEQPASQAAAKLDESLGEMPLYFVENRSQLDDRVAYYVLGGPTQVYFAAGGVTFALTEPDAGESGGRDGEGQALLRSAWPLRGPPSDLPAQQRWVVKLDFVGANPGARPVGEDQTEAVVSYFRGEPDQWHAGLPTYARVVYRDLWPGIDLAYYGQAGQLKYDFLVHPGADPAQIRLGYRGAESVTLNAAGQMAVSTPLGDFVDDAPVAWQEIDGQRLPVPVAFDSGTAHAPSRDRNGTGATRNTQHEPRNTQSFSFSLGAYDRSHPLVIDPAVLLYCGFIGGPNYDSGSGIAVDGSGNAYVGGTTTSTEDSFPVAGGPDLTYNGDVDAFVAKVGPSGATLVYAGYIGGEGEDVGYGIAVDGVGNAYVTGETNSAQDTFPVTGGPDPTFNGEWDAFVAKVSASGAALVYAGYIGGSDDDVGSGIAVDGDGNAYVTGNTASTEDSFPVAGGPDLTYNGDVSDAFVAKVSATGAELVYAGYIGGSGYDVGYSIAVDGAGNACVTGWTNSTPNTFPLASGPDLTYNGGYSDAFVAKVSPSGAALLYAGYIGGSGTDVGSGIAVDAAGNAYVTGHTNSTEDTFPVVGGPDLTFNGYYDAFVAKVSASGAVLVYCGYIGGSGGDYGIAIAVDGAGNADIAGYTTSTQDTFPVTSGPDLTYNGGIYDAFVAKVSALGAALVYAGYIGGSADDVGNGIAVDGAGNAHVTGYTTSAQNTFPVIGGPDPTYNGYYDAFVAKVVEVSPAAYLPLMVRGN